MIMDLHAQAFLDGLRDRMAGSRSDEGADYIGTPYMASYLEGWDFGSI